MKENSSARSPPASRHVSRQNSLIKPVSTLSLGGSKDSAVPDDVNPWQKLVIVPLLAAGVLVVLALLVVAIIGSIRPGEKSSGHLPTADDAALTVSFLSLIQQSEVWHQELCLSNSTANPQLQGVRGQTNPTVMLGPVTLSFGTQFEILYSQDRIDDKELVLQLVPATRPSGSESLIAQARGGSPAARTMYYPVPLSCSNESAKLHVLLVSNSVLDVGCVYKLDESVTGSSWVAGAIGILCVFVVTLLAIVIVRQCLVVTVHSRLGGLPVVATAARTLSLEDAEASVLRESSCVEVQEVTVFDMLTDALVVRLREIRKHLPQIVVKTQGALVEPTLMIPEPAAAPVGELELGRHLKSLSSSVSGSPHANTMGSLAGSHMGGSSGSPNRVPPFNIDAQMMVSYDAESPSSISLNQNRNPLLPAVLSPGASGSPHQTSLMEMLRDDIQCNMLLKRATFVVCRLFIQVDIAQEDLAEIHAAGQSFYKLVSATAEKFDGIVHSHKLDEIVVAWNAFRPYPFHESRGSLCALHIAANMGSVEETWTSDRLRWCLCVNTGAVVVSESGSIKKQVPSIVGDSLSVAIKSSELGPTLQSNVITLEHTHVVARNQVYSIPIDVIGNDTWRITLFDLKGTQQDWRAADSSKLVEGFSLFSQHKFAQAESAFFSASHSEPQAKRLLELCHVFERTGEDVSAIIPNPYRRQVPMWGFAENDADEYDVTQYVGGEGAVRLGRPGNEIQSRRTFRRPSINPQDFLRDEIAAASESRDNSIHGASLAESGRDISLGENGSFGGSASTARPPNIRIMNSSALTSPVNGDAPHNRSYSLPAAMMSSEDLDGSAAIEDDTQWTDRKGNVWRRSERRLGKGSFGAVYVGLSESGELVAIKLLPLPSRESITGFQEADLNHQKAVEDVLAEVGTLSVLRHENVVRYYSSAVVAKRLAIVMEYVGGGSLSQLLNRFGALPPQSIRRYATDILRGLQFLHQKTIVHRDINPNNVLITVEGNCKLSDFGASKSLTMLSFETTLCGTPPFMAPEACRGSATYASDVWGFGVMLIQMFTGYLPYPLEDLNDVPAFLRRVATDSNYGPTIPPVGHGVTKVDVDFIQCCLNRDEHQRHSAEQLLLHPFFMN